MIYQQNDRQKKSKSHSEWRDLMKEWESKQQQKVIVFFLSDIDKLAYTSFDARRSHIENKKKLGHRKKNPLNNSVIEET